MMLAIFTLAAIAVAADGRLLLGDLPTVAHGVRGKLYAEDARTLFIEHFYYDGFGPDAFHYYFEVGETPSSIGGGIIIPASSSSAKFIFGRRYIDEDVTVTLPEGKTVCDIGTYTIWCRAARQFFTRINIASVLSTFGPCVTPSPPTRVLVGSLPTQAHGVRGKLYVEDKETLFIEQFFYDGFGPDAFHYFYEIGVQQDNRGGGTIIPATSSNDRLVRRYTGEDITVTLPKGTTICDIGIYTIWCRAARQFFTSIEISINIRIRSGCGASTSQPTPMPTTMPTTMPTAAPTPTPTTMPTTTPTAAPTDMSPDTPCMEDLANCIQLDSETQLSWSLNSVKGIATFRLRGCLSTNDPSNNEYIGFGLSGSESSTLMDGADAVITWVDGLTGTANAVDYFLSQRVQCRNGVGVCPDELDSSGNCTNDVFGVSGVRNDGEQCVTYSRNLTTADSRCDKSISASTPQYVVWGVGGLGETAFKHFKRASASDPQLEFGGTPRQECTSVLQCQSCASFPSSSITAPKGRTFKVKIGPSGLNRGYTAITGLPGWGIAYWIDGVLIPELVLTRGETYTFVVEAGNNTENLAEYHPLYITDSLRGGRLFNTDGQREEETIYAGFDENDQPTGAGRLCELTENDRARQIRERCGSREEYSTEVRSSLNCRTGNASIVVWTPDDSTPDLVYYQCAAHLSLGWKINLIGIADPCAAVDCEPGTVCRVHKPTKETFCETSCDIQNGGCPRNRRCQLNSVECVRAPCPRQVECVDPCATVRCGPGTACKVYEPTKEAFCEPSCDIQNGGCPDNRQCQLISVTCKRAPCPQQVECVDPCATVRCGPGTACKVYEPTKEAFCEPSCNIQNGGCSDDRRCQLKTVQCIRAPCPQLVQCVDPCATVRCGFNTVCEVYEPTKEPFCTASCEIQNGGCPDDKVCRLRAVNCIRAPCPSVADCLEPEPAVVCSLDVERGSCEDDQKAFYFNAENGSCEPFRYSGCGGNHNRFATLSECRDTCSLCILPPVRGPCEALGVSYFFNSTSGGCEMFVYGGCEGNGNQFGSLEQCQGVCGGGSCPPTCSSMFCERKINRKALCSRPGPRDLPGCTGSCQLGYCQACYYSDTAFTTPDVVGSLPSRCQDDGLTYTADSRCFYLWANKVYQSHRRTRGRPTSKNQDLFKCYSPPCFRRG